MTLFEKRKKYLQDQKEAKIKKEEQLRNNFEKSLLSLGFSKLNREYNTEYIDLEYNIEYIDLEYNIEYIDVVLYSKLENDTFFVVSLTSFDYVYCFIDNAISLEMYKTKQDYYFSSKVINEGVNFKLALDSDKEVLNYFDKIIEEKYLD